MDENTGPVGVGAAKQPTRPIARTSSPTRLIPSLMVMAACTADREGLIAELLDIRRRGFGCNESKGLRIEPELHVEPELNIEPELHIATGRGRHLWERRECRDGSPHGRAALRCSSRSSAPLVCHARRHRF